MARKIGSRYTAHQILGRGSAGTVRARAEVTGIVDALGLAGDPAFLPAPPTLGTSTLVTASDGLRLRDAAAVDAARSGLGAALDEEKAHGGPGLAATINVVAMDWKWLFIYPEQHIATVNFVQMPVNVPVRCACRCPHRQIPRG